MKIFVDVGAYIGAYTLRAAKHGAKVYSFEPNPYSFNLLLLNVKDNGFEDRVILYNVALGDRDGEISLALNLDESHVSIEGYKVKMRTLDSFNIRNVDLLKIDVEGFEKEVLLGSEVTLGNTRSVIIEVSKDKKKFVEDLMIEHGLKKVREELTYPNASVYYLMFERRK
uniref:FkbM family methyltransferase n=1 Tax=Sulfurisphaera ohwakuensis TaxID=69656 RepID=UPI00288A1C4E|nr:FkbM family methyltransferase [Sulfurisphaera ohwakuensis]